MVLSINTTEVSISIKSKGKVSLEGAKRSSLISVYCGEDTKVFIDDTELEGCAIPPLFFEYTDYELVVESRGEDKRKVEVWNENHLIRDSITPNREGNTVSGIINFESYVGFTDFEIRLDGVSYLRFQIEVYPSKLSYKDDYRQMIDDITEMVCEATVAFLKKTYQTWSLAESEENKSLSVYFSILSTIFDEYMKAINRVVAVPHHKLITEHVVLPAHKVKRTDRMTEKWILNHGNHVDLKNNTISADKILVVRKQVTYDTAENRFVKFVLLSTIKKIQEFIRRYTTKRKDEEEKPVVEEHIVEKAKNMIQQIRRVLNNTFLRDVSDYTAMQSMSLVFGMAPGYRELYKHYLMLRRSLTFNGDVFRMSVRDTAKLYEYWCFIKLYSILKKEYTLESADLIQISNTGISVNLTEGKESQVVFSNPKTKERILLTYNQSFDKTKTQTSPQKPDNILELEKLGSEIPYKYIFDAKYRIESKPKRDKYPDDKPGPKVEDINTMHRYRDSIVYDTEKTRFTFEKTMFGAYVLFPYDNEKEYKNHQFYKSIEKVNIGGLPFLPGTTDMVKKLIDELIDDSKDTAFERATLPLGIEERLAVIDWDKRDVLVASVDSDEQLSVCLKNEVFYVPKGFVGRERLPIHYIALYQSNEKFNGNGEIRWYGEVIEFSSVKRKDISDIPLKAGNGEEPYYRIVVKKWCDISEENESKQTIRPKEFGAEVSYTNMFLLKHSELTSELQFKSENAYRLYHELKRKLLDPEIIESNGIICFSCGGIDLFIENDVIKTTRTEGISLKDFAKKPTQMVNKLLGYSEIGKSSF